jgi:hypothetical protein
MVTVMMVMMMMTTMIIMLHENYYSYHLLSIHLLAMYLECWLLHESPCEIEAQCGQNSGCNSSTPFPPNSLGCGQVGFPWGKQT